ncbi:hypothetical protein P3X46_000178 [Hevea brasiliensis]|uniref:Uncharacterized protein n=1 Tax=Hevea brasiliensis TaxID=3981 RepID=A0ABQ9NAV6_HEVBR|nr:hypothetical protein P3X46_000178 [Hevea brasiliensis]
MAEPSIIAATDNGTASGVTPICASANTSPPPPTLAASNTAFIYPFASGQIQMGCLDFSGPIVTYPCEARIGVPEAHGIELKNCEFSKPEQNFPSFDFDPIANFDNEFPVNDMFQSVKGNDHDQGEVQVEV